MSSTGDQLTDWLSHVPKEVLAKNFRTDISAFDHIPAEELYIFPAGPSLLLLPSHGHTNMSSALPLPDSEAPKSPQGTSDLPFTFEFSKVPATKYPGGTVKVSDSSSFKISKTIAAAEVTVEPGAMRSVVMFTIRVAYLEAD